jgi:hypothetical protein
MEASDFITSQDETTDGVRIARSAFEARQVSTMVTNQSALRFFGFQARPRAMSEGCIAVSVLLIPLKALQRCNVWVVEAERMQDTLFTAPTRTCLPFGHVSALPRLTERSMKRPALSFAAQRSF